MRLLYLFIFISICLSSNVFAQTADTLVKLQAIEIVSTRYSVPVIKQPTFTVLIDTTLLSTGGRSFGDILSQYSSIFVKSNAPGAVSTISFRGFGGEQTRVLWEGMQINHSMLGLVDFSLLRSTTFSSVEISPGSSSSMYGSGISGTVALSSDIKKSEWQARQAVGSNGNNISSAYFAKSFNNWSFGLNGIYQQNDNDYRYFDRNTQQIENRKHASFDNIQAQAHVGWKRDSNEFKSKFWYLKSDHEIPENVFVGSGNAQQFDRAYRWVNSFRFRKGANQHQIKSYVAQTELDYIDKTKNINSLSTSREWNNEWQLERYISEKLRILNVVSVQLSEIETNNYSETKVRNILSEQVSLEWFPKSKLRIYPNIRVDKYNDFGFAFSPSLGVNYELYSNKLYVHSQASRNFRAPTFNDLYWPQGGNEDLLAEQAFTIEVGIGSTNNFLNAGDHNFTFFRTNISDGIRWTPNGSSSFEAQNYLSLLSYGLEWNANKAVIFGKLTTRYAHNISYTRATIDKARFDGDQAVNNQLPYVPKWKYSASVSSEYQNFKMTFANRWVGSRFSTEQNNLLNPEPAYVASDVSASYVIKIQETDVQLLLNIGNVFNQQYEVVRLFPQPLRNLLFTINIKR